MPINRRAASLVIGAVLGLGMFQAQKPPHPVPSDWEQIHIGARALLRGDNPYVAVDSAEAAGGVPYPLPYPGTAFLVAAPFAPLPFRVAVSLWCGLSGALLAWALSRRGYWGYYGLLSMPFLNGYFLGQWSPIFTAATAIQMLGFLWIAKPNIGLPYFVGWPSRPAAIGCAIVLLLSFICLPHWPAEVRTRVQRMPFYSPIVTRPGGVVLLLALFRWRQPEARMLAALAVVPQTGWIYELIPLLLIPRTAGQMVAIVLLGWLAFIVGGLAVPPIPIHQFPRLVDSYWPFLFAFGYLPALYLVLADRTGTAS